MNLKNLGFLFAVLFAVPAQAQGSKAALNGALIRLNRNPQDAEALIAAGNAALATGDTDAAVGFFTRADLLSPDNPRIEAGLASAKVRGEDPFSAIPLFIAAEKAGPLAPDRLGDQGLAYDLIGDNANAQQYYRQALAAGANASPEVSRRLALSLAIAGDRRGSETVLSGLLQKQDRAAWRTRIFALAILGYEEEAVATAKSTMPPDMALQIAPYLRYMRRLTPAQQAAAANLGHFPQAAQIGQDDPRVAQYAGTLDRSRLAGGNVGVDRSLVPAGAPLGTRVDDAANATGEKRRQDKRKPPGTAPTVIASVAARGSPALVSNTAPPEVLVSRETGLASPGSLTGGTAPPRRVPIPAPVTPVILPPAPLTRPTLPAAVPTTPALGANYVPAPVPLSAPLSVLPPRAPQPPARPSFTEAFSAMSPVVVDITPERGAVDLRKIAPARAVPKPPPAPPPPSHPSRIWVELGVGRDPDRLAFDWRRMVKDDPEIFKTRKPFVTSWARTNRLLVGPFESGKAANAFNDRLHKADHPSAFVWTSPAGQVVDPLDAR